MFLGPFLFVFVIGDWIPSPICHLPLFIFHVPATIYGLTQQSLLYMDETYRQFWEKVNTFHIFSINSHSHMNEFGYTACLPTTNSSDFWQLGLTLYFCLYCCCTHIYIQAFNEKQQKLTYELFYSGSCICKTVIRAFPSIVLVGTFIHPSTKFSLHDICPS